MKNFASRLLVLFLCLLPMAAFGQSTGRVVADCTTGVPLAYPVGTTSLMTMLADGRACVNASVSASITGFPGTTQSTGTPISVTTGGVTGTLPAGAVVVASNVGTTNAAYCKLGAAATTSDQYIAPGSWFAFTVGSNTQLTCITSTSTTTVNMVGGSGLPTGSGGSSNGPYPPGAVPYTATATGTTAATTATLAGAASVTTYLCGFSIRANATAAATGNATVTGVITATLNYTQWTAPLASGVGVVEQIFTPCIPASGTNQSIAVISAAPGSGGTVSVTAWGYKL